jgi:hypothetical protein
MYRQLQLVCRQFVPLFVTSYRTSRGVNLCRGCWEPLVPSSVQDSLSLSPVAPTRSIGHPSKASFHFSFLILTQSVGLLGRAISPTQGHKQNKRTQTSVPRVAFEHTIPVFEQAKTVHVLHRAATVIGNERTRYEK